MRLHTCFLRGLLSWTGLASASFVYTGATVQLGDVNYFINPEVAGTIELPNALSANGSRALVPVTLVSNVSRAKANLEGLADKWLKTDDVFQRVFLDYGVFSNKAVSSKSSTSQRSAGSVLPPGPYFVNPATGDVHRVYRLYDDFADSFTSSLLQARDGSFGTLPAQAPAAMSLTTGVPSRLYYTRTQTKPLAGVRIGVKDLYNLKGVKQSNGNRAWYHLYPPAEETSPAVQRLVDAGAVIVGFQVPAQFANGDTFTGDWVDFHSPFNPRGDGYQVPLGSSSGAGASIASYDWLDVAIGSDTGGSVRNPAQIGGIFGNRPTFGAAPLDLVTPLAPSLDTAGVLTRDPELWDTTLAVLYGKNYTSLAKAENVAYPSTIYTVAPPPGFLDEAHEAMLANFTKAAARFTGANVATLEIDALWNKTRPEDMRNTSLNQLLDTTYVVLTTMEQARLVRDPFFEDYAAKHNGRKPYINPSALARWNLADTLPESDLVAAHKNQTIFMNWFSTYVLSQTNDTSCSSALLLYPGLFPKPLLRDMYTCQPAPPPYGLNPGRYSSFSGAPDIAVPIGEIAAASNVTGMDEMLPVPVNMMAARGCDGLLTRLVMDLVNEGTLDVPKAGSSLYGGEILFKRSDS